MVRQGGTLLGQTREGPHDEPESERLGRNVTDLLNELRVAGTGIQVMFAFLLVVPFNTGWKQASTFDQWVYFTALLSIATASVLLIAPSVHHRLLFRQRERAYLVRIGTRLAIIAAALLGVGLTAILVLISNVVFGTIAAVAVGIAAATVVTFVWFALPLRRRDDVPEV
jgi:putative flippase GtrA